MSEETLKIVVLLVLLIGSGGIAFLVLQGILKNKLMASVCAMLIGLVFCVALGAAYKYCLSDSPIVSKLLGRETVEEQIDRYGPAARARLTALFRAQGLDYPPTKLTLIGLKTEKQLELYVQDKSGAQKFASSYPILGISGHEGPKLANLDFQVPEGFYRIEAFQPTTPYHLALRVNYPNDTDRSMRLKMAVAHSAEIS